MEQNQYDQCFVRVERIIQILPRPFCFFAGFGACAGEGVCWTGEDVRWRRASYMTTAPATETLREATWPAMGMRRRWSQVFLTRSCSPAPSRPRTRQQSVDAKSKAV